jgi:serine/threonine protein kinase
MTLERGARLGAYEILSLVGAGGMGEVYRARDSRLGRDVAVKILPPSFSADADRLSRFEQEARLTASLNHPNLLTVHELGRHDGQVYIVSELRRRVASRAPRWRPAVARATDYALQIANGLAAAHERDRPSRPEARKYFRHCRWPREDSRFRIGQDHRTRCGRNRSPTANVRTDPGAVMGTVGNMSPEQVRGQNVDARSDIFSFGAVLYEMLTGKRAFMAPRTPTR